MSKKDPIIVHIKGSEQLTNKVTDMDCKSVTFINMTDYVQLQINGKNVVDINNQIRQFKSKQHAESYLNLLGLLK